MLHKGVLNKYCSRQSVSEEKDDGRHNSAEESLVIYSYESIDELQMTDRNQVSDPSRCTVTQSCVKH